MHVAVVGSGYVGLVPRAYFADLGHQVILVDNVPAKLAAVRRARSSSSALTAEAAPRAPSDFFRRFTSVGARRLRHLCRRRHPPDRAGVKRISPTWGRSLAAFPEASIMPRLGTNQSTLSNRARGGHLPSPAPGDPADKFPSSFPPLSRKFFAVHGAGPLRRPDPALISKDRIQNAHKIFEPCGEFHAARVA